MENYFSLYNIPVTLHPDPAVVKKQFYSLSRQYHPDHFAQADAAAQTEALRMAALNNDAYKTLNNSDRTVAYILKLNELLEDEEKYNLPPAFLMEMMDLNEAISDYDIEPDNETAKTQADTMLQEQLAEWNNNMRQLAEKFDAGDHSEQLLLQIKDQHFRKKYLLRIQERIDRFAPRP